MTKTELLARLCPDLDLSAVKPSDWHFAPSNIALGKYWGKRDAELNLPLNSSLSISLDYLGSRTRVMLCEGAADEVVLNNRVQDADSAFAQRVSEFIDLLRGEHPQRFRVETSNNIPTAAGLASSASGFAALTLALVDSFNLTLSPSEMSVLARMGSGSACRSLFTGFVEWQAGIRDDGMDSFAQPLEIDWPGLCIGLVKVDAGQKAVNSRNGMNRTRDTSTLFKSWPEQSVRDMANLHEALESHNFELLGSTAEQNAMAMHATMIASWPPLLYWQPESVAMMQRVWQLRNAGLPLYFTMDAGPNLKLLFEQRSLKAVQAEFGDLEVVTPFDS